MKSTLTRRSFICRAALAAGAASATRVISAPNILAAQGPSDTLNCVLVGCGGRGMSHLEAILATNKQNLIAIVDPDPKRHAEVRNWMQNRGFDGARPQAFTSYREMFDKVVKQADAIFCAAPNHHHATVAMTALQLGKNIYCEKPVCHLIGEARRLRAMAKEHNKVATQMGNQGHCQEGYHRLCEFIWGGLIGNVTETHSWTDRANGGAGPRPPSIPAPAGMNWDQWIGPAPYRDFHDDLHPHEWHGWYDFGNGSIGNMGCHVLDGVFWALKVEHPTSVEVEYLRGGSDERYPLGSRIRWDIPARGDMPACKSYWYEGLNPTTTSVALAANRAARGDARNFPALVLELKKQYPDEELDRQDSGTIYVGEKGIIHTGTYGDRPHLIPQSKMQGLTLPPKTLPRPNENIFTDFIGACRAGRTDTYVSFDYGTRLTEFAILGNLAQHAGMGKKVEWDGPNMRVTNIPELNQWVSRDYRKGWHI